MKFHECKKPEHCEAKRDKGLHGILHEWQIIINKYIDTVKDDPWWQYSERPYTGFLAAAVWRTKGIALEEWRLSGRKRSGKDYARNDLWIRYDGGDMVVEAKHTYLKIAGTPDLHERSNHIKSALRDAERDARRVRKRDAPGARKMGVLFLSLSFTSDGSADDLIENRASLLWEVYEQLKPVAIAWVFKDAKPAKKNRRINNGVVLLGRRAQV